MQTGTRTARTPPVTILYGPRIPVTHPLPPAGLAGLVNLGPQDLDLVFDLLDRLVDGAHLELVLIVVRLRLSLNRIESSSWNGMGWNHSTDGCADSEEGKARQGEHESEQTGRNRLTRMLAPSTTEARL